MSRSLSIPFLVLVFLLANSNLFANCTVFKNDGTPAANNQDLLFRLLTRESTCPKNVIELHTLLQEKGYSIRKSLVSNQGFHSKSDSFSLFEWVTGKGSLGEVKPGDFFLGHFTASDGGTLIADQSNDAGSLMIELELKDSSKDAFNFYELRGIGNNQSQWFYRGDSDDIYADLKGLHLNAEGEPIFGDRLRCSGCHLSGGPIMKELTAPHNDWWTSSRPVDLSRWAFAPDLGALLSLTAQDAAKSLPTALSDAQGLADLITTSAKALVHSPLVNSRRKANLSPAERLRPLFCPMELNLESSATPIDDETANIEIPSGFFVDPRLASLPVTISRKAYLDSLTLLGSQFPMSDPPRIDSDHPWLTPVKSRYDQEAIAELVAQGEITSDFVAAVLSIDFTNPVFSHSRCALVRFIPRSNSTDWQTWFRAGLANSDLPQAKALLRALTQSAAVLTSPAKSLMEACARVYADPSKVKDLVKILFQRRAEAFASDISKNPRGQILEPNFRVIFPQPKEPAIVEELKLDPTSCKVTPQD